MLYNKEFLNAINRKFENNEHILEAVLGSVYLHLCVFTLWA